MQMSLKWQFLLSQDKTQPIDSFPLNEHLVQGGCRAWPILGTEALWGKEQAGNTAFCLIIPAFWDLHS